jgi:hypothetical protein
MNKNLTILTPIFSDNQEWQGNTSFIREWNSMEPKNKGRKIFPSLVNKEPIPEVSFKTHSERNKYNMSSCSFF